jgi:hypothetical protein
MTIHPGDVATSGGAATFHPADVTTSPVDIATMISQLGSVPTKSGP